MPIVRGCERFDASNATPRPRLTPETSTHTSIAIAGGGTSTTFIDVLQAVPLLLYACVNDSNTHSSLATLRLVCKPAGRAVVQAISKYSLKLSGYCSETEHLSDVAKLLCNARLRHLALEITIPQGMEYRLVSVTPNELRSIQSCRF